MTKYIIEDLEISSDDWDKSDEEKFFFNKCSKKFHEHEKFALCKLLPSLDYTLTILLTIL